MHVFHSLLLRAWLLAAVIVVLSPRGAAMAEVDVSVPPSVQELAGQGLAIELFWVLALLALNQFLWRRGLRRHTAVGG